MPLDLARVHASSLQARALLATGLRWWWTELAALVAPVTRRFVGRVDAIVLVAGPDGTLSAIVANRSSSQADKPLPAPAAGSSPDWRDACAGRQVVVCLDTAHVMRLTIQLPRGALARARDAVAYKLIVESPVPPEAIYFDFRVPRSGRGGGGTTAVEVALCRRAVVDAVGAQLEAAGVSAATIGFSATTCAPLDFVFLASRGMRKVRARRRIALLLAGSASAIAASALPATDLGAVWLTRQVRGEIQAIRGEQGKLMQLYEQRATVEAGQRDLAAQVPTMRVSKVLNELAASLPKTAWLQGLRYEHGEVSLSGYAPIPAEAAQALARSTLLSRVKLGTVSNTPVGQEVDAAQFELTAQTLERPTR